MRGVSMLIFKTKIARYTNVDIKNFIHLPIIDRSASQKNIEEHIPKVIGKITNANEIDDSEVELTIELWDITPELQGEYIELDKGLRPIAFSIEFMSE